MHLELPFSRPFRATQYNSRYRDIICKYTLISREEEVHGRKDTSKWRHGIPRSSIPYGRLAFVPRVSAAFRFTRVWWSSPRPFSRNPPAESFLAVHVLSLVLEPLLRRRSFPYPRFFNSRAWALVLSLVLAFTPHVLSFFAVAFFFRFPLLCRLLSRTAPHCAPKSTRAF